MGQNCCKKGLSASLLDEAGWIFDEIVGRVVFWVATNGHGFVVCVSHECHEWSRIFCAVRFVYISAIRGSFNKNGTTCHN